VIVCRNRDSRASPPDTCGGQVTAELAQSTSQCRAAICSFAAMAWTSWTNGGLQRQRIGFHISWNPTQTEKCAVDQSRTPASRLARTSVDASLHNFLAVSLLGGHLDFTSDLLSISTVQCCPLGRSGHSLQLSRESVEPLLRACSGFRPKPR